MRSECKYSFNEAKLKLESFCAYQERCTFEIQTKLSQWNFPPEESDKLINHLRNQNFLNEERFVEAFISGKVRIKRWGRNKIRQELRLKKIPDEMIKRGLSAIDSELYYSNLEHLARVKSNQLITEKDAYSKKVKIIRFLASKGYEQDLIFDAIGGWEAN